MGGIEPDGSKPQTTPAETTATTEKQTTTTTTVTTTEAVVTTEETTPETTAAVVTTEEGTTSEKTTALDETTTTAMTTTKATAQPVPENVLYGDVNLDGKVELADAIVLNKSCAGQVTLTKEAGANADCDANGIVDTGDAVVLLRFLVHLENQLPVVGS